MQKVFTIFLLAAMMCVSVCGCSNAPATQDPEPAVIERADEDAGAVATALVYDGDTDALETAIPTEDTKEWDTDYLTIMRECCLSGDVAAGRDAESNRNAKIAALNLDVPEISFDELFELSKTITNEAGSSWIPMDWKMMVGEVVLNRVASVEFPNTVIEVIHQKGQYSGANSSHFDSMVPFEDYVDAAIRLLSGERLINDVSVVFQSEHRQGSGTYLELYDSYYGYTYLCYSNHPELYE